ncbi:MAG: hypothetical protein IPK76_22865 [Lewinellaceae bacterium]|nr:hypothetical protein [Lewinellaceae bacterium]
MLSAYGQGWTKEESFDLDQKKAALWIALDRSRQHWLLVVYLPDGHALVFDSLKASLRPNTRAYKFIAEALLEPYNKNWSMPQVPQQTDGTSCGLFALFWAGCVASAPPLSSDALPSFDAWRLPKSFECTCMITWNL